MCPPEASSSTSPGHWSKWRQFFTIPPHYCRSRSPIMCSFHCVSSSLSFHSSVSIFLSLLLSHSLWLLALLVCLFFVVFLSVTNVSLSSHISLGSKRMVTKQIEPGQNMIVSINFFSVSVICESLTVFRVTHALFLDQYCACVFFCLSLLKCLHRHPKDHCRQQI